VYKRQDHSSNGIQASRAIALLIALTGNLDVPGAEGFSYGLRFTNLRLEEKLPKGVVGVGDDYPIFSEYVREQTVTPVVDQMITDMPYPIKALLICGCNPALTWPNTNKFMKGREKLDLMLVIDLFMTDTAKMADIVLPGTTFLERPTINQNMGRGHSLIALGNPAVKPVGNCMEDWRIWVEIGKKMGYSEYFPWQNTDELLAYLLEPTGITLEQLRQNPGGIYYAKREFRKYLKEGFSTPSGKVEIYSNKLEEYGHDPMPTFHEPIESPVSRKDLADKYPLLLVGGPRTAGYLHSQHRNLPTLRKLAPEPLAEINSQTARELGINDGELVTIESVRGSIVLKIKITDSAHPKVVTMQHGWSEASANCLTDDIARDPISGYVGFRHVMCRVMKSK